MIHIIKSLSNSPFEKGREVYLFLSVFLHGRHGSEVPRVERVSFLSLQMVGQVIMNPLQPKADPPFLQIIVAEFPPYLGGLV